MNFATIPASADFLDVLAHTVLEESERTQTNLSLFKILLSNRRSCLALREAFLKRSAESMFLLPAIRPIGEVEEEELLFSGQEDIAQELIALPPAISPLRRQFMLMRLIHAKDQQMGYIQRQGDQALKLADALGHLLDQVIIEEISLDALTKIVPDEFAEHWGITLDFLSIIREEWPKILSEQGVMEASSRRIKLLDMQSAIWQKTPPVTPVILAGSTGTMPATVRLMRVVATLPRGQVILPGLDLDLDEKSWEYLELSHPQRLFKDLLHKVGCTRTDIHPIKSSNDNQFVREKLARELMRPAQTTDTWRRKPDEKFLQDLQQDLSRISLYECTTVSEEAMVIALEMRSVLEQEGKTALLVTPDRALARQVQLNCRRWGIKLDDSGGQSLKKTRLGQFLLLTLSAFQHDMRPTNLLALIKHSLCALGLGREILERDAIQIDKMWRGPVRGDLFCERAKFQSLNALYNLSLTYTLFQSETAHPFAEYVEAHISLLEDLAASDTESGSLRLWIGEEGDMAAHFFYQLRQDGALMGDVTATEYAEIFEMLLGKLTLRPRFGTHPRLQITGQIEARLIKADVVILGGLNEGTWPALPPDDPWMSRPMRKSFGLPDLERNIALSAHDFIQAFSASQVVLTRSLRREGTPTVAARWLQRFDVYLQSCGLLPDLLRSGMMKSLAGQLDKPTGLIKPADRPQPSPPLARRPQSLPVTAIETWMRDPYSLYAKYILKLTYLDPVEQESDAALHGQWLHSVLEWFIRQYPNHLPTDSVAQILSFAKEHDKVPRDIALLLPRLQKVVSWFVLREEEWRLRAMVNPQTLEINGTITLENGFVLSAKADRIDSLREGTGSVIIDYKTGSIPTISSVKAGLSPQMSLEGAILNSGGFEGVRVPRTVGLYYLKLGGRHGGVQKEIKATKDETLDDLICQALSGLENLVEKFSDPATAYISLPDPAAAPPEDWQNYAHLARVQEWKTIEDGESAGGEE